MHASIINSNKNNMGYFANLRNNITSHRNNSIAGKSQNISAQNADEDDKLYEYEDADRSHEMTEKMR